MFRLNDSECKFGTTYQGNTLLMAVAVFLSCGKILKNNNGCMEVGIEYLSATNLTCLPAYVATTQGWSKFKKRDDEVTPDNFGIHVQTIAALVLAEVGGSYGLRQTIREIQQDTVSIIKDQMDEVIEVPYNQDDQDEKDGTSSPDLADALAHLFGGLVDKDGKPNIGGKPSGNVQFVKASFDENGKVSFDFEGGDVPPHIRAVMDALKGATKA